MLPDSKSRIFWPSVKVSVRAGIRPLGLISRNQLVEVSIGSGQSITPIRTVPSGCSWRCQSSPPCMGVYPTVSARTHQLSIGAPEIKGEKTYPNSSSAMEILIPLGVCVVYSVMSGLFAMVIVANGRLRVECARIDPILCRNKSMNRILVLFLKTCPYRNGDPGLLKLPAALLIGPITPPIPRFDD